MSLPSNFLGVVHGATCWIYFIRAAEYVVQIARSDLIAFEATVLQFMEEHT